MSTTSDKVNAKASAALDIKSAVDDRLSKNMEFGDLTTKGKVPPPVVAQILGLLSPGQAIALQKTSKSMRVVIRKDLIVQDRLRAYLAPPTNGTLTIPAGTVDTLTTVVTEDGQSKEVITIQEIPGRQVNITEVQRAYLNSAIVKEKIRAGALTFDQALAETQQKGITYFNVSQMEFLKKGYSVVQARPMWVGPRALEALNIIIAAKLKETITTTTSAAAAASDIKTVDEKTHQEAAAFTNSAVAKIHEEAYAIVKKLTPQQIASINSGHPWNIVVLVPDFSDEHAAAIKKGNAPESIRDLNAIQLQGLAADLSRAQVLSSPHFSTAHVEATKKGINFKDISDLTGLQVNAIIAGFTRQQVLSTPGFHEKHIETISKGYRASEVAGLDLTQLDALLVGIDRTEILDCKNKVEPYHTVAFQNGIPFSEVKDLDWAQVEAIRTLSLSRNEVTLDANGKPYSLGRKHLGILQKKGKDYLEKIRGLNEVQVFLMGKYDLSREEVLTYISKESNYYSAGTESVFNQSINEKHIAFFRKHKGKFPLEDLVRLDEQGLLALELGFTRPEIQSLYNNDALSSVIDSVKRYDLEVKDSKKVREYCMQMLDLLQGDIELIELGFTREYILECKRIQQAGIRAHYHVLEFLRKKRSSTTLEARRELVLQLIKLAPYVGPDEITALELGITVEQLLECRKKHIHMDQPGQVELLKIGVRIDQIMQGGLYEPQIACLKKKGLQDKKEVQEMADLIRELWGPLMEAVGEKLISRETALKIRDSRHFQFNEQWVEILRKDKTLSLDKLSTLDESELQPMLSALEKGIPFGELIKLQHYQIVALSKNSKLTLEQVKAPWFTPQHATALTVLSYSTIESLNGTQLAGVMQGLTREQVLPVWFTKRHLDAYMDGVPYKELERKLPAAVEKIWNEWIENRGKAAPAAPASAATNAAAAASVTPMYAAAIAAPSAPAGDAAPDAGATISADAKPKTP